MLTDRFMLASASAMLRSALENAPAEARSAFDRIFLPAGEATRRLEAANKLLADHPPPARKQSFPKRDALAAQIEEMKAQLRKNGCNV